MAFLQPNNSSSYLETLNGKHFVIGTINLPPFISYTNVSSVGRVHNARGLINEIVLYLAAKYHFNFEYVNSIDYAYGSFENGSWNGLVGMLYRKELDLVAACLAVTYPRSTVIDFSAHFYEDVVSILIPYPTLESTINGITRPFQYEIWILILMSVLIMTTATWKIFAMELWAFDKERNILRLSLYASFWSTLNFNNTVIRLRIINSSRLPMRLVATVWCLAAFVLFNAYSSTLTACLMTPRYHPMINSIKDIASISRPVLMVRKSTSYETAIFNSKEGSLLKIGDSLRNYPELRIEYTNIEIIVESVIKNQRAFTTVRSSLLDTMEKDLKKTGQCRLYLAKEPWDIIRAALALPKFSPLTPTFNQQINWLRDVGLLDYWERRNWPKRNRCSEPLSITSQLERDRPLNFDNLSSAFILLGCGLLASFAVFLIESTYRRVFKRK